MKRVAGSAAAHDHLVRACVHWLKLNGCAAAAVNQRPVRLRDGRYRNPGAPAGFGDVVACLPPDGHMLMIECKTGRATLSAQQVAAGLIWSKCGATWLVVRSVRDLALWLREWKDEQRRS